MKKFLTIICILIFVTTLLFTFNISKTYAGRGCCSWHGGVSHCGSNGRYVCNDGTYSPTCTCNSYDIELTDTYDYSSNNCSSYQSTIDELEVERDELIEEIERLENEKRDLSNWISLLILTVIIFVIYIIIKKKEN